MSARDESSMSAQPAAWPWAIAAVGGLAVAAHFWPAAERVLAYDRARVVAGEFWRLWTAHVVHYGGSHLLWNLAVLLPAGAWAERLVPGRTRLFLALAPGAIGSALFGLDPSLQHYAGLSGVAAGAIALLAFVQLGTAARGDRWFWRGVLGLILIKIAIELGWDQPALARFNRPGVQPVPLAHIAGVVCAVLALRLRRRPTPAAG